ncbi:hypothetical protein MOMA_03960 [Moraxella macacae 0408225]|uniref:HMA domain-containing protein n=1 Tax=Moraxella macacae 0408225 TaxID=1230338 RepID=L2FAN8_9GAMM|nr:hypothetical protein [Moraxella macacae]ELA09528.1 hypothetical protein MOMA_03960 [Moraxella macacae 0408225]
MPQVKYENVKVADKAAAEDLTKKLEGVVGVKFANVNHETGVVVVTHGDDYDEGAAKSAMGV